MFAHNLKWYLLLFHVQETMSCKNIIQKCNNVNFWGNPYLYYQRLSKLAAIFFRFPFLALLFTRDGDGVADLRQSLVVGAALRTSLQEDERRYCGFPVAVAEVLVWSLVNELGEAGLAWAELSALLIIRGVVLTTPTQEPSEPPLPPLLRLKGRGGGGMKNGCGCLPNLWK